MEREDSRFGENTIRFISIDDGFCNKCKHIFRDGVTCKAFSEGIPEEILRGQHDHREPYKGDNGIQFEPISE